MPPPITTTSNSSDSNAARASRRAITAETLRPSQTAPARRARATTPHGMRRGRILGTAALALALLPAATAHADTLGPPSFVVSDPAHGHATSITFTARLRQQDESQQPTGAVLRIAKGYRLDTRALTAGCTADQAQAFSCPAGSRFGGGHVEGHLEGPLVQPNGRVDFLANVDAFMGPPEEAGDLAAVF